MRAPGLTLLVVGLAAAAALLSLLAAFLPRRGRLRATADLAALATLALATANWGLRWWEAGHLPIFGTYESALSLAVATLAAALLVRYRGPGASAAWPLGCGVSALLLAHGLAFDTEAFALTISERSWVVDLHALAAWAAFGALAAHAGVGALRLRTRGEAPAIDSALATSLSLGFLLHTAMMASGSFYKFLLFGSAWSFDPIETMGLAAWMAYGTLLHMQLLAGWSGRRLARWGVGLFLLLIVSYRGIVYFPSWSTYHIFDMNLRIHLTGDQPSPGGSP